MDAAGGVVGRVGRDGEGDALTLLRLAQMNGVRLLLVPASSASGRQVGDAHTYMPLRGVRAGGQAGVGRPAGGWVGG